MRDEACVGTTGGSSGGSSGGRNEIEIWLTPRANCRHLNKNEYLRRSLRVLVHTSGRWCALAAWCVEPTSVCVYDCVYLLCLYLWGKAGGEGRRGRRGTGARVWAMGRR